MGFIVPGSRVLGKQPAEILRQCRPQSPLPRKRIDTAVGIIAAYDIATEQPVLLDVATVLALIAFLGTVAFAHYLARRGQNA